MWMLKLYVLYFILKVLQKKQKSTWGCHHLTQNCAKLRKFFIIFSPRSHESGKREIIYVSETQNTIWMWGCSSIISMKEGMKDWAFSMTDSLRSIWEVDLELRILSVSILIVGSKEELMILKCFYGICEILTW